MILQTPVIQYLRVDEQHVHRVWEGSVDQDEAVLGAERVDGLVDRGQEERYEDEQSHDREEDSEQELEGVQQSHSFLIP